MNRKIASSLISVHESKHPKYQYECYCPLKVFGRKIQKGFKFKRQAEDYKAQLLDELEEQAVPLDDEIRLITKRFQGKLTAAQIEAALTRQASLTGEGPDTPLSYFCEELIEAQQDAFDRGEIGIDQLKNAKRGRNLVKELKDMAIGDVTEKMVKKWVTKQVKAGVAHRTCKNRLENLRRWISMAITEGRMDRDPLAQYKMSNPNRGKVTILRPREVAKLVLAAVRIRTRSGAAPALAWIMFGCFAGLRTSEIRRLTWEDVDLDDREIWVQSRKTARFDMAERFVKIIGPLYDYCKAFKKNGATGLVTGLEYTSERSFSKYQRAAQDLAGVDVPKNACRHTYGSHHLRKFQDSKLTAMEMGHSSPQTTFEHYRRAVKANQADRFWDIESPKVEKGKKLLVTRKPGRPCKINDGAGDLNFVSV